MARIKQLPIHEAQKIAAGEVVDRPANVVKELIENAIDAQATQISVYIEQSGKKLIRVVDNGCGMNTEDAHLCFNHHATSKITSINDLNSLTTFGFRGEALSSIASVSKAILSTQEIGVQSGITFTLEQGIIREEQSISRPVGTDIAMHDLFYNVPARKKFLKTHETEWRHIVQLFYSFCLAYHSIHFILYSDGKQLYNCPPVNAIMDRVAQLWDHHLVQNLLELESIPKEENEVSVSGVISNHSYSRFDRSMIFLFVNHRWIKNYHLSRALLRGYENVLQPGHFPVALIFISVDPRCVDINIHPRKEEVKFLHPRIIETNLQKCIKQRLQAYLSEHLQKGSLKSDLAYRATIENSYKFIPNNRETSLPSFDFNKSAFIETYETEDSKNSKEEKEEVQANIQQNKKTDLYYYAINKQEQEYAIIGQLHKTYILLEQKDGLFVIDQHAAHERILYEQFSKRFEETVPVKLLFPQVIKLNTDDLSVIKFHLSRFTEKGIDIELFGNDQLIVHATPVHLKNVSLDDLVKQTVSWIIEYQHLEEQELHKTLNEKMHAKMACSAAVKAGDELNMQQMQQLIYDLENTDNRLTCPHGRPTGWLLPLSEIRKRFKRDYRSSSPYAANFL
ncbi:DNA mismatch repair endonuclease MutL [Candidatus Dependentiae bacterium]|nr:MAG: DNA mismatch repair endonuclease MutL [Candidatus Dependentiae bacterium]